MSLSEVVRRQLAAELDEWQAKLGFPRFEVWRIRTARFGVVDPDRARFLGLTLGLDGEGAGSAVSLGTEESLAVIEEAGSVPELEGLLCWVRVAGPGASSVVFARLWRS